MRKVNALIICRDSFLPPFARFNYSVSARRGLYMTVSTTRLSYVL